MLVLTRKAGEQIVIGDGEIVITVLENTAHPSSAKLGIDAPDDVPVHRREIFERIKSLNPRGDA